jgi:DNA-binding XRE family transcriptional regulator
MSYTDKKEKARALFINSSLTAKDIAAQVGVTEKTLRKWRDDEGWENLKELKTITRSELLQDAYSQLKQINNEIATTENADIKTRKILFDAKAVLGKEIDRLSESPLHVYIGVFDDYTNWVSKNYPAKLQELTAMSLEFIEEINIKRT